MFFSSVATTRPRVIPEPIEVPSRIGPVAMRLPFLDGIRGLAALYVVIHHIAQLNFEEFPQGKYHAFLPYLMLGHFAVAIFIVLSGFCLMLPVARSSKGELKGEFVEFMWRRTRRIVPACYAAMAMSLLMVAFIPSMRRHDAVFWGHAFAGPDWRSFFDWKVIASHLLILHALSPNWITRIDPPMWSIGIEWINYLLMPLLLVPIWRKGGVIALVAGAMAISFLPYATPLIFHHDHFTLHWMKPWFIALFAAGMAGAAILCSGKSNELNSTLLRAALHPAMLAGLALGIFVCRKNRVPVDFLASAMTLCVIFHAAIGTALGNVARRVLESRIAMSAGMISYSLYLFHYPLLVLVHRILEPLHFAADVRTALLFTLGMPIAIGAGWMGYRVFEKPFLAQRSPSLSGKLGAARVIPTKGSN